MNGTDPAEFFKPHRGKWNPAKFAARTPLSTVVGRPIRLERAPAGSQHWKEGLLLVVDVESGVTLATLAPSGLRDPATGWDLRPDC